MSKEVFRSLRNSIVVFLVSAFMFSCFVPEGENGDPVPDKPADNGGGGGGSGESEEAVTPVKKTTPRSGKSGSSVVSRSISVTVSDLNGTLVLRNNGVDDLTITTNGVSTFPIKINQNDTYNVSVLTNPTTPDGNCTVASGSGTVGATNVTDVTVSCTDIRKIYISATDFQNVDGNFTSISEADTDCNDTEDLSRPSDTATYKALLVDGTNRVACTTPDCAGGASEHTDWIIAADTHYTRPDGTLLFTSDSNGIFVFGTMDNSFSGISERLWTGIDATWVVDASNDCSDWAGGSLNTGAFGLGDSTSGTAIASSTADCDTSSTATYLICVEQ